MKITACSGWSLLAMMCVVALCAAQSKSQKDLWAPSRSPKVQCSRFGRTELSKAHPELRHLKFVEEPKPYNCFYCNYICNLSIRTNFTELKGILTNNVVRLFIFCNNKSLTTSSFRLGRLKMFRNLFDIGFFGCKFNENVNIGDYLEGILVTRLFFRNSYKVANLSNSNVTLPEHFYNNPKLATVHLSENSLTRLPNSPLCQWKSLVTLRLDHNRISDLSSLFQWCNATSRHKPLQMLEYLDVSYNELTLLNQELMTSFPLLRRIFLNNNKIHTIVTDIQSLQSALLSPIRKLDLSNKNIQYFTACNLLPYIISLHLSGNPFACSNCSLQLEGCQSLLFLHMNNAIAQQCNDILKRIASTEKPMAFALSNNDLRAFDFSSIPKTLFNLNVVGSNVQTLTDINNISSKISLTEFNFSHNKLTKLVNFSFPLHLVTLDLGHNQIGYIESLVFTQCTELSYICLNNNKLTDVSSLFNHLQKLVTLNLQNNNIVYFDYDMIPFSLLYVSLSNNNIMEVTDDNRRLKQIQLHFLNLSNNHFITLTKESFAPSIFNLDLSNCEVDSMQDDVFENVALDHYLILENMTAHNAQNPYLKHGVTGMVRYDFKEETTCKNVEFFCVCNDCNQRSNNQPSVESCCNTYNTTGMYHSYGYDYLMFDLGIKQVMFCLVEISCFDLCKRAQFYYITRYQPLKKLYCSKNIDFSSIFHPRSILYRNEHFPKQRGLMLKNMSITRLNDGAFDDFQQLIVLNLNDNLLTEIHGKEFRALDNLTKLYLNQNRLSRISDYALRDLQRLTFLEMKHNNLRHIRKQTFAGLLSLRRLYLTENHLELRQPNTFANLLALEKLYLTNNEITKVDRFTFTGLSNLRKLYLNKNRISIIENFSFVSLSQLQVLNLEHNRILSVPNVTFHGLHHLTQLTLHSNRITHIGDDSFSYLLSLNYLYLHNNQLKDWFVRLPTNLLNLTLSQNHFPCDCKSVFRLQEELAAISKTVSTDADQNRCIVQNSYFPHISIKDMTDEECYNATTIFHTTSTKHLLAVSLGPAAVLTLLLFLLTALYLYRLEVQVLLYSKFNMRLGKHNKDNDVGKVYDAFLSYSSDDRLFIAEQLLPKLEERFSVCVHERDFPVGAYIADTIADVVENSCRTVAILSASFAQSGWCLLEFKSAHYQALKDKCCRLIVIVIEEVDKYDLNSELRAYIRTNTFLRWGDPLFWEKLMYAMPHKNKLVKQTFTYRSMVE